MHTGKTLHWSHDMLKASITQTGLFCGWKDLYSFSALSFTDGRLFSFWTITLAWQTSWGGGGNCGFHSQVGFQLFEKCARTESEIHFPLNSLFKDVNTVFKRPRSISAHRLLNGNLLWRSEDVFPEDRAAFNTLQINQHCYEKLVLIDGSAPVYTWDGGTTCWG